MDNAQAIQRRVHRIKPEDVFGPASGPLEQHAREMAHETPFSFEQIRQAVFSVNDCRRALHLPEIPASDWIVLIRPGAQLAALTSLSLTAASLFDAYWSITQVAEGAWSTVNPEPDRSEHLALIARLEAMNDPPRERRSFKDGLRRHWWER